jgi:hypothetical protein
MTDAGLAQRRSGLTGDKILRRPRDRLAIVYVRQSTAQQVERQEAPMRAGGAVDPSPPAWSMPGAVRFETPAP